MRGEENDCSGTRRGFRASLGRGNPCTLARRRSGGATWIRAARKVLQGGPASCPRCGALMGHFPMTARFFIDAVDCTYPDCGCSGINVHGPELACHVFEYRQITLNVGQSEVDDFPPGEWKWRPFTRGTNTV